MEREQNMKVVEYDEINQLELKHEFLEYRIIPHVHAKSQGTPKGSH